MKGRILPVYSVYRDIIKKLYWKRERMIDTMFMDKMAPGILRLSVMDNDIDLFEGQYPVPQGVSYNTYLIEDDQLCLLDTVDARKQEEWLAGLDEVLAGRKLDYLVISHMEPDHAGSIAALCARQPQLKLVANARTFAILDQFSGDAPLTQERVTVADGGTLALGAIVGSIHKIGALTQGLPACNGWTFWHVERNGTRTVLDALRSEIRAGLL